MKNPSAPAEQGAQVIRDLLSRPMLKRPRSRLGRAGRIFKLILIVIAALAVYAGLYPWAANPVGHAQLARPPAD
jgi:Zn-dependent protease